MYRMFEIESVSEVHRTDEPHFATAKIQIRLRKEELNASDVIGLKLRFIYNDEDTIRSVHEKILEETREALRQALDLCAESSLEELREMSIPFSISPLGEFDQP